MTAGDDYLIDDILGGQDAVDPLETEHMPAAARFRRAEARRRFIRFRQKQALGDVMDGPPAIGESVHLIGPGTFDFWTWVPVLLDWIGRTDRLSCSTWTTSRPNVVDLLELWDTGRIGTVDILTGLYFKRRETASYALLLDGIRARGGRYRAFLNHAKVLLLATPDGGICVEGSANLTGNPRLENYVITRDAGLYRFHRDWMEEALTK